MIPRRDKTWAECWELTKNLYWFPDVDSAIRDLEARCLSENDWAKVFLLTNAVALGCIVMVGMVFWIVWRALLWSLGLL